MSGDLGTYDPRETDLVLRELAADPPVEFPPKKELILRGRASLADLGWNPDDHVPGQVDDMLQAGVPAATRRVYEHQWGRFIHWAGTTRREHLPPTVATMRYYIWSHWSATRIDGTGKVVGCGRRGRPYAHNTVKTAVYSVSSVLQWLGHASPTKHPSTRAQLKGYKARCNEHKMYPDIAHALTPAESVAMARSCDLATVQGLRMAAMCRLQYDIGARESEIIDLDMGDVSWLIGGDAPVIQVIIRSSKGNQDGRTVLVEATPEIDGDVDPALLLGRQYQLVRAAGYEDGPLFRAVNPGNRRKDGLMAGTILPDRIGVRDYEQAHDRCVARSGVGVDPVTGKPRRVTSHSERAGMITAAMNGGMLAEQVAPRTGHKPGSPTIHEYWRGGTQTGADNAGTRIRMQRQPEQESETTP